MKKDETLVNQITCEEVIVTIKKRNYIGRVIIQYGRDTFTFNEFCLYTGKKYIPMIKIYDSYVSNETIQQIIKDFKIRKK